MATATKRKAPVSRNVPDHFYVEISEHEGHEGEECLIFPTSKGKAPIGYRYEERPFSPLPSERRFLTHCDTWRSLPYDDPEREDRLKMTRDEIQALLAASPGPTSYVEFPHVSSWGMSYEWANVELMTRKQAFAAAAEANEATLRKDGRTCHTPWIVVFEIGQGEAKSYEMTFDQNGMGVLELKVQQPVRLVIPTAAELAKYAFRWVKQKAKAAV